MSGDTHGRIAYFLGVPAGAGGPFALLQLDPATCTDSGIIAALELRLGQVNAHPHAETPQADEVRLALHAAAAQLLDPVVRRHMLERWGGSRAVQHAATAPAPATVRPHAIGDRLQLLEHDAVLTLARHGGWNRDSLRRVAMLAHARGIPSTQVPDAVRAIAFRPRAGVPIPSPQSPASQRLGVPRQSPQVPRAAPAPSAPDPRPAEPPPMPELEEVGHARTTLLVLVGVIIAAISVLGVLTLVSGGSPRQTSDDESTEVDEATAAAPAAPSNPAPPNTKNESAPSPQRSRFGTPREAIDALVGAATALDSDASAASARFVEVADHLAQNWPTLADDELAAAVTALVEFVYRAGPRPDVATPAVDHLAGPAAALARDALSSGQVAPAIWSCGVLTRLARERDLPSSVVSIVDNGLASALGGVRTPSAASFQAGALAAASLMPASLAVVADSAGATESGTRTWERWLDCVEALTRSDERLRASIITAGLDQLLIDAPNPDANRAVYQSVQRLATALDWSRRDVRLWLLRAMIAPSLGSADLNAVTRALVHEARAPGTDGTMVLPPKASERDRAALRERFARVWGIEDLASDRELLDRWAERLRGAIARNASDVTPMEHLESAARLASLSAAASWMWRGEYERAARRIERAEGEIQAALQRSAAIGATPGESEGGEWAVQYLVVRRNQQARLDLLDTLVRTRRRLSAMDAEVLIGEAVRGDAQRVRLRANEVARAFLDQPTTVNALLEALPDMPASRLNAQLIAQATGGRDIDLNDPAWRAAARRILVERLLQMITAESELSVVDRLSDLVAEAYAEQLALGAAESGDADSVPAPEASATLLRVRWLRRAEASLAPPNAPMTLGEIEARYASRAALASGPVQRFAAEQLAIVELMAYVTAAEQPTRARDALAIVEEMSSARRRSEHVFQQLAAAERALAQLWTIRMSESSQ
ncbi:MAG: hypothetical protein H6811_11900 [Phycisphaeraceae bacterium]|nr:hypothetical protein [Phycisphaeraceae bacterium]